jgi:hypothetical protein
MSETYAEESGERPGRPDRRWVVDALSAFARDERTRDEVWDAVS